jgi:hypothetical protein
MSRKNAGQTRLPPILRHKVPLRMSTCADDVKSPARCALTRRMHPGRLWKEYVVYWNVDSNAPQGEVYT